MRTRNLIPLALVTALGVACAPQENKPAEPVAAQPVVEAAPEAEPANDGKTMYVNSHYLNVRPGPSMDYDPVKRLQKGDEVKVQEVLYDGVWMRIGPAHYVGGKFLSDRPN